MKDYDDREFSPFATCAVCDEDIEAPADVRRRPDTDGPVCARCARGRLRCVR